MGRKGMERAGWKGRREGEEEQKEGGGQGEIERQKQNPKRTWDQ